MQEYTSTQYEQIRGGIATLKVWEDTPENEYVHFDWNAKEQGLKVASLPIVPWHVAAMPDGHFGMGAMVGSVIPTEKAVIPSAVGVDGGCGMIAVPTNIPDHLLGDSDFREEIYQIILDTIPVGFNSYPKVHALVDTWRDEFRAEWEHLAVDLHPEIGKKATQTYTQLGTLGGGNHFIEISVDEAGYLWIVIHSGSRQPGNRIAQYFISKAQEIAQQYMIPLPDKYLAYLPEGTELFDDYMQAIRWAQRFAKRNREIMLNQVWDVLSSEVSSIFDITPEKTADPIQCHHNYIDIEHHFGRNVYITRKGAIRARKGDLGIIPGDMGHKTYIVRGLQNDESYHSASHGAGRTMSRGQAKQQITVEDHIEATAGVVCRKDAKILDESPVAYKNIETVMAAQQDLVEPVHELQQLICVKG